MKAVREFAVLLCVVLAPWLSGIATAQTNVTFADPNLEAAVRSALGKPTDPLTSLDLALLTSLTASGSDITNLSGLEWATNLTSLDVSGNFLKELTPLAGLYNLASLNVGSNLVTNAGALSDLTNLSGLWLSDNRLDGVAALTNLAGLTSLALHNVALKDIEPLATLTQLSFLELRWNPITNAATVLPGLTNVTTLYLGGTSVSNVAFLTNMVQLRFLNLDNNKINDVSPLATLTNLDYLALSENPVTDYSALSGLENLTSLELRGNSITNLTFVSSLVRLGYVDLAYNGIVDISPSLALTNLHSLVLSGNPTVNQPTLAGMTNLVDLWLSDNSISNLTFLEDLSQLRSLNLDDNQILDLTPMIGLTNLTSLGLSRNPIADYSVLVGLNNLNGLQLAGNSISNLSFLPSLTGLATLELRNNQKGDLDALVGLTNMVSVCADYNRLTNITALESLSGLSNVRLIGNPLDVGTGSNAVVIQNLQERGVSVAYLPTNEPPGIWVLTNWSIAVNESASLGFQVSDDITSFDQLLIAAESSNPGLIPNASISLSGTNFNRILTVTPVADQTGTATVTLTAFDAAGSKTSVHVQIEILVPQPVFIPDPNLATAIGLALNEPAGALNSVRLLALNDLFLFDTNITSLSSLSGLEWAANLKSLYLRGGSITNLTVLQDLSQLTSLTLLSNNTADLSQLAGLTNLLGLHLTGNSISNLAFLQNLTRLRLLGLDNNLVADLSPLDTLTNLHSISLRQNRLTNLATLQSLPQLTDVDISVNLLDIGSNSPVLTQIQTWKQQGVVVDYLPQREPPIFDVRQTWRIPQNTAAALAFEISDNGLFPSQFAVTASSGSTNIIPNESVTVGKAAFDDWNLSVTPATNQIGTTLVTLTATNDVGLGSSITIVVEVVVPLPLGQQLLEGANLTWLTGGDALWFGQSGVSHGGGSSAQSGSLQNNQESWMETTLEGPGVLTFWWKVSSEESYDWLELRVGGLPPVARISGQVDWRSESVSIPRGIQVARWRYYKDDGYGDGMDTAWVDQVSFLPLSWLEVVGLPSNGQCELLLHPVLGKAYQLQTSTNMSAWFPLAVLDATNTAMPFLDMTANSSKRFYRLQELSIQLRNLKWIGNAFQLEVLSPPGLQFEIQASTNLVGWSALGTISNALGTVQYTDTQATNLSKRFYRALLLQ